RRQPIDIEEFERRLRGPEPAAHTNDPLADLARLVAGEGRQAADPFAAIFKDSSQKAAQHQPAAKAPFEEGGLPDISALVRRAPDVPRHEATYDDARFNDELDEAPPVEAPAPADYRASSEFEDWGEDKYVAPDSDLPPPPRVRSRKPLYLTAGVIAAGVAMIGVSLAWRGGSNAPAGVSIIKAASGPTKVQPADAGASNDVPGQQSTMLDKSATTPQVKTVTSRDEAPMDVNAAEKSPRVIPLSGEAGSAPAIPKPPARAEAAAPPAAIFPEPKKVKTVAVRADGSIISGEAKTPAAPVPTPRPAASTPAKSATPKSDARAAAPTASHAAPKAENSKQKAEAAKAAAKPKEVAAAEPRDDAGDAAPAKPAANAHGAFAVQLAAPGSESEARALAQRFGEKYSSALGGRRPSVQKASDKAVWRVRVAGLSREAAVSVCERIKAAGGACFVAH
ncbi:MAG: SPOR domain-containing protein, partial [Hyphomicrobiales bacterium]|nr:SPOR domain-containing protein [Hyphomicrobiales bacterium]